MKCPKCFGTDVSPIGTTHYLCNNPECMTDGKRTQFRVVYDDAVKFPYNQIYVNHPTQEFYREPLLELQSVGSSQT